MRYIRLYEDFEWDFDFEEELPLDTTEFKVGDEVRRKSTGQLGIIKSNRINKYYTTSGRKVHYRVDFGGDSGYKYLPLDDLESYDNFGFLEWFYEFQDSPMLDDSYREYCYDQDDMGFEVIGFMNWMEEHYKGSSYYNDDGMNEDFIIDEDEEEKLNEDFDWTDEDFDEEEVYGSNFKVGDKVYLQGGTDIISKERKQINGSGPIRGIVNGEYHEKGYSSKQGIIGEIVIRDDGVEVIRFRNEWPFRVSSNYSLDTLTTAWNKGKRRR